MELIKAIICAGLYPNIAICKMQNKNLAFYSNCEGRVEPEPSSLIAKVDALSLPWLVYTRTIQGTCYLNDLTNVGDYTLLMFGGTMTCHRKENSAEMLRGFLRFSTSKRALKIILVINPFLLILNRFILKYYAHKYEKSKIYALKNNIYFL